MEQRKTGYPSIDKPWMKYYPASCLHKDISKLTLYQNIFKANENNLDGIALEYYGNKITYKRFFQDIEKIASALTSIGVKPKDVVAVCDMVSISAIELVYAINKIGAIANLIPGLSEPESLCQVLVSTNTKYLFALDIFAKKMEDILEKTLIERIVLLDITSNMGFFNKYGARYFKGMKPLNINGGDNCIRWKHFVRKSTGLSETSGNYEDIALLCYTGGTTSTAKSVMLTNYAVNAVAEQYLMGGANVRPGQKWLNYIPVFVAFGFISSIHLGLLGGNELILRIHGTENMGAGIEKYNANHVVYGPYFWEQMADVNKKMDLSELVEPTSGGDRLQPAVEEKINRYLLANGSQYPLLNGYGMTEAATGVAVNSQNAHKLGSVGIPLCKNTIAAFDIESGAELPYGEEGELCVKTPSVMSGYWQNPQETDKVLKKHSDGNIWVHTGDMGFVDEDGFVFIQGRLKRLFLYAGNGLVKKVFCLQVEKHLQEIEKIESCAVVSTMHKEYQNVAVYYIKIKPEFRDIDHRELEIEIREYMNQFEESYRPGKIVFVEEYPLTSVSKIDYRQLEKMAQEYAFID